MQQSRHRVKPGCVARHVTQRVRHEMSNSDTWPVNQVDDSSSSFLYTSRIPQTMDAAEPSAKRKRSGKAREEAKARAIAKAEEAAKEAARQAEQKGSDEDDDEGVRDAEGNEEEEDPKKGVPDIEVIKKRIVSDLFWDVLSYRLFVCFG